MTTRSILLILLLFAYCLPVFDATNAALRMNAYDLAEWISLIPSQRNTNPALFLPFALRIHLVFLCLLIALSTHKYHITIFFVVLLVIAQLPPLEMLTSPTDINYQQQLLLATVSLLTLIFGHLRVDYRNFIMLLVPGAGIVLWVFAGVNTFVIYRDYTIHATSSLTIVCVPLLYGTLLINTVFNQKREHHSAPVLSITTRPN